MAGKIRIEPYLLSPGFTLVVGLLLVGFGFFAVKVSTRNLFFFVSVWVLFIFGVSATVYGFMGVLEGKPLRMWNRGDVKAARGLAQELKIRYPTYILKVHKLKETHDRLHAQFGEVRDQEYRFREVIKTFRAELIQLGTVLQESLQQAAPLVESETVEGVAQKIRWTDKQLMLTQLETALETLVGSEAPMHAEDYRNALSRVRTDFKQLEGGTALYHELLTTCTKEKIPFERFSSLKREVAAVDARMAQHETALQTLETDTQTRAALSEMGVSLFQDRLETFRTTCGV